jgi:hypothetical protein
VFLSFRIATGFPGVKLLAIGFHRRSSSHELIPSQQTDHISSLFVHILKIDIIISCVRRMSYDTGLESFIKHENAPHGIGNSDKNATVSTQRWCSFLLFRQTCIEICITCKTPEIVAKRWAVSVKIAEDFGNLCYKSIDTKDDGITVLYQKVQFRFKKLVAVSYKVDLYLHVIIFI